jgi:hypothetical protein
VSIDTPHTRTPRARCHRCGSSSLAASCGNCGRFLCEEHDAVADLAKLRKELRNLLRRSARPDTPRDTANPATATPTVGIPKDKNEARYPPDVSRDQSRPLDDETIKDSKADRAENVPTASDDDRALSVRTRHFCQDCIPLGTHYDPVVIISFAAGLLGTFSLLWSTAVGVILIGVSVIRILIRVTLGIRRRRAAGVRRRRLYLDPRIAKLEMVETLSGCSELTAAREVMTEVNEVTGEIDVEAVWSRGNSASARKHCDRVEGPDRANAHAVAGSLVLTGPGQLTLKAPDGCRIAHPSVIELRPRISDHAVLRTSDGRGDPRWQFKVTYEPTMPEEGWRMPLWVTPSFAPGADRRALDLHVQWRTREADDDITDEQELRAKELTSFEFVAPPEWGDVELMAPDAEQRTVRELGDGSRRIKWRKPPIKKEDDPGTPRGTCVLSVAFSRRIEENSKITGSISMKFDRTLSGADGVRVHAAGGGRRKDGAKCKVNTKVILGFTLSLAAVRYQDVRAVPDPAKDAGPEHRVYKNLMPDHHTVAHLVNVLSRNRYYVKSVLENPPRPGAGAGVLNRFWDITGRRYNGVHPTDFHLVLTGEETEPGSTQIPTTTVRVSVRGAYATPRMEERIVAEHEQLWRRIDTAMKSAGRGADGGMPRTEDEPIDSASARVAELGNVLLSIRAFTMEHERDAIIPTDFATKLADRIDDALRGDE